MEELNNEPPVELRHKEKDSTTLKQCGWCKFTGSGSFRHSYMISGSCNLAHYAGGGVHSDVKWDTPCIFTEASRADISAMIDGHQREIKSSEDSIQRHGEHIAELTVLQKNANDRPTLPQDRSHDHFDAGDPVVVFCEGKWRSGTVEPGYRHHDGCVSYRMDGFGPQDSGFWGCGTSRPEALLAKEAEWFANNQDQFVIWLDLARGRLSNVAQLSAPIVSKSEVDDGQCKTEQ